MYNSDYLLGCDVSIFIKNVHMKKNTKMFI